MRSLEETVVHAEERFRAANMPPPDLETRRKESSGFSFAIGMRPQIPNQTTQNVVDITDYQTGFEHGSGHVNHGVMEIAILPVVYPPVETKVPLAATLGAIKPDYFRLKKLFPPRGRPAARPIA